MTSEDKKLILLALKRYRNFVLESHCHCTLCGGMKQVEKVDQAITEFKRFTYDV